MKRYIDADALLERLKKQYGEDLGWQCTVNMSDVGAMIEDAPTADAVEVVRCKDCKRFLQMETSPSYDGKCLGYGYLVEAKHYCSYGERRGSND